MLDRYSTREKIALGVLLVLATIAALEISYVMPREDRIAQAERRLGSAEALLQREQAKFDARALLPDDVLPMVSRLPETTETVPIDRLPHTVLKFALEAKRRRLAVDTLEPHYLEVFQALRGRERAVAVRIDVVGRWDELCGFAEWLRRGPGVRGFRRLAFRREERLVPKIKMEATFVVAVEPPGAEATSVTTRLSSGDERPL